MNEHEKGMALVLVLIFTALMLLIGSALINFAFTEKQISLYQADDVKQYYLAEAGIEAALSVLNNDIYHREDFHAPLGDGLFSVSFEDLSETKVLINSTGLLENSSITMNVYVEYIPGEGILFVEWLKP